MIVSFKVFHVRVVVAVVVMMWLLLLLLLLLLFYFLGTSILYFLLPFIHSKAVFNSIYIGKYALLARKKNTHIHTRMKPFRIEFDSTLA